MKVLTEADGLVLANLCLVHSHLLLNLKEMRLLNTGSKSGMAGMIIANKGGYISPNQIYLNVRDAIEQELKLCREFGLSPSSRTRIETAAGKPREQADDPWAKF